MLNRWRNHLFRHGSRGVRKTTQTGALEVAKWSGKERERNRGRDVVQNPSEAGSLTRSRVCSCNPLEQATDTEEAVPSQAPCIARTGSRLSKEVIDTVDAVVWRMQHITSHHLLAPSVSQELRRVLVPRGLQNPTSAVEPQQWCRWRAEGSEQGVLPQQVFKAPVLLDRVDLPL